MNFRHPTAEDGAAIWRIVRDSGVLDLNSSYCYLMMGHYFGDTCIVAEDPHTDPAANGDRLAGFIVGFRPPQDPATLFVWQVAVDPGHRGKGVGSRMLQALLAAQPAEEIHYIEATISPSNTASQALFRKAAATLKTDCSVSDLFLADMFPGSGEHEPEHRYRIGPFTLSNSANQ
ncbi:diaminobutyrate acetyltransferase [Spirochaeta africana]|uniref:L-2,4-diaminobutyric acid acetyltransferase n=1 Tax=Spirochaeta africana (strain ATCC 700263 / DSM 8902 / Z-7692) TaxID=889378 RepID=H9UMW7_SPIAZ|nr:diaminobutyrate acetyltransferase [Spirochaeta africana]AFG38860.1 diaminobutyrate acetyltransferase [Spirochaeta africana DSM 8902]